MNRSGFPLLRPGLLAAAILLVGLAVTASAGQPPHTVSNGAEVEKLIAQLRDPNKESRAKAADRLMKMPEAVTALRKALESSDPFLQVLVPEVLRECLLRKNRRMASGFPVDLLAERLVQADDTYDVESYWRVMAEAIGKVLDSEERTLNVKRWVGPGMA